ncbi:MAG: phenylalanine--tRNA ligase subunit beta [Prevotellaceae bacterium]|jgi:phenylalanyl-tRNA synthetase beta chain|nr:phenylalanine--tRNA ligase subunit beta [Prevotellaceae bacterium]
MTILYNWLKDYLLIDETPDQVSVALTSIGLEVESLEKHETVKGGLQGVLIGKVLTCKKHPCADKLSLTIVDIGAGEPLQIVCGAPNVAEGQKVAVATVGTTLYFSNGDEVKIKKSKIRGVESFGMICAEDELGLGTSHEGIMVLSDDAEIGKPLRDHFNLTDDYIFEIGLTPNRIDAASHIGVVRDLAAFYNRKVNYPDVSGFAVDNCSNPYSVEIENKEACPRYTGIIISNVKVGPSPKWLQGKLRSIGINPKNNVVDSTNFILHEIGQPLHAFDADKIDGKKVVVRTCPEGTPFTTLDGVERKLNSTDLMICSATKPICIAGILGGLSSGVTEDTVNVFLESAYFNPVWVRKTARRHGIFTDASFRYERGADPNITEYALKRAAMLIKELAGGEISSDIVDIYPDKIENYKIELSYEHITRLVGKVIAKDRIKQILRALDISVEKEDGDVLHVSVPTYRVDVKRECDVIEEILRIYGYNNIEISGHVNSALNHVQQPDNDRLINIASDYLSANGFHEIMSNSLTKADYYTDLTSYKLESSVRILNPLSSDLNVMRQTLLFGGLEAVANNINRRNTSMKFYELGNCYFYSPEKEDDTLRPYHEEYKIAFFVTGNKHSAAWNEHNEPTDFYTLKGYIEHLLERFGVDMYKLDVEGVPADLYSDGFTLKDRNNKTLLNIGIVSKKTRKNFDINQEVYYAEINWAILVSYVKQHKVLFRELPRYPEVRRDLALVLDKNVQFAQLRAIALKTEETLLKKISLFDVYEGNKLSEGKKQYALSFTLQDENKTLTDNNIDRVMDNLLKAFEKETGAILR